MNSDFSKKTSLATFLTVCGFFLANGDEWQDRLSGGGNPNSLLTEAKRERAVPSFLAGLSGSGEVALKAGRGVLARALPGGDLANGLSEDAQVAVIASFAKSDGASRSAAYRLWRIHELTPNDGVREAALAALKSMSPEALPEGVDLSEGGATAPIDPAKMARGKEVYMRPAICFTCHQPTGEGIPGAFPPLAGSEWMDGDTERQIKIVLKGLMGPLEVKGEAFNSVMTPLELVLKDNEIADVLTYVRNEWGNKGPEVTTEQVAKVREAVKDQKLPYQVADLLKAHPLKAK